MLRSLTRSQPHMLHRCARPDGKARVRDGLRLVRAVRFDERDVRLFADADRMLKRIHRRLVVRRYENQMDRLFEPRFRRNGEDRSIGRECGAERRDDVALPEGELRDRLGGSAVILQRLMQGLERHAMRVLDGGQIRTEAPANEHRLIGIQVSERFPDCRFDADIGRRLSSRGRRADGPPA